jgi:hypothetical protein
MLLLVFTFYGNTTFLLTLLLKYYCLFRDMILLFKVLFSSTVYLFITTFLVSSKITSRTHNEQ